MLVEAKRLMDCGSVRKTSGDHTEALASGSFVTLDAAVNVAGRGTATGGTASTDSIEARNNRIIL